MEKSAGTLHGPGPVLQRHPDDGWILAAPIEVGARTRQVLLRLADAILPPSPRTESTLDEVTEHALVSLRYMPRSSSMLFLVGMHVLNWSPLWRLRGLRPLTALRTDAARRHLLGITRSRWLPVRLLMYGPLGLFMSSYFDQDYVHRELQYAPKPFIEQRIELRRKWIGGHEPGTQDGIHHPPARPR
ncbi:MAG: hypothetical protein WCE62_02860 [Polyangiales bacterium]